MSGRLSTQPSTLGPRIARQRIIAALIFVAALGAYGLGARTQGNVRDEGFYFEAAELYWGWWGELGDNLSRGRPWESFRQQSIDRWFGFNHEHPAVAKMLFGISWRVFHRCSCPSQAGRHPIGYPRPHRTLGLLSEEAAMRLPTQVLSAMMIAIVFLFGARLWSTTAGLVAAALTLFASRLFFDAQLACFDAPIAALWVAVVYTYLRAIRDGRWRSAILCAVTLALALGTKHNAFFLPPLLVLHWLWTQRATLLARRLPRPLVPKVFVLWATASPLLYWGSWPWMWFDTLRRFREYVGFHVHHVYYNMEFLGQNYNKPPFPLSYPYVMTALTVPVTTLLLGLIGSTLLLVGALRRTRPAGSDAPDRVRGEDAAPGLLIGMNALFPMMIITITRAPIFGATKHWHASIPFLALLAAYAVHHLTARWRAGRPRERALSAAFAVLVCAGPAVDTYRSHPFGLSHYTMLGGGPMGGATLGMNRQFWGYSTRQLIPWLNQHARRGAPVYWHDTNQDQLDMHVRQGRLRPDLVNTPLEEPGVLASDIAMVIHEKHFNKYEYWIWDFYGTTRPSVVLDHLGVPVVTLYERPADRPRSSRHAP